jgi:protein ImuA
MSALLLDAIPSLWRASDLERSAAPACPSGFAALDAELPGGGWPCGQLTEVLQPEAGWREWRLLAPSLARLSQQGAVVLVGPPLVPHLPALAWQGLALEALIWVQANSPAERLWAAEQALRCQALSALLVWLPQAVSQGLSQGLRRLQLAAQAGRQACPPCLWALRPWAAQQQASPAPLRLGLRAGLADALEVEVLKRRGRLLERSLLLPAARPSPLRAGPAAPPPHTPPHTPSQTTVAPSPNPFKPDRHVVDRTLAQPLG